MHASSYSFHYLGTAESFAVVIIKENRYIQAGTCFLRIANIPSFILITRNLRNKKDNATRMFSPLIAIMIRSAVNLFLRKFPLRSIYNRKLRMFVIYIIFVISSLLHTSPFNSIRFRVTKIANNRT